MDKKLNHLARPHNTLLLALLLGFSVVTMVHNLSAGVVELVLTMAAFVLSLLLKWRSSKELSSALARLGSDLEESGKDTMLNAPFPIAIFRPTSEEIIWSNDRFTEITGAEEQQFAVHISSVVPGFSTDWLERREPCCPTEVAIGDRRFQVYGHVSGDEDPRSCLATTFWLDVTDAAELRDRFYATRPVVFFLLIDTYEEMVRSISEKARADIRASVEDLLTEWIKPSHGLLLRYERGRYLYVCEEQYLNNPETGDLNSLLSCVRSVVSPNGINATLSVGIGRDGDFGTLYEYASAALDMALARGGDQAVVKSRDQFAFYGGHSQEREVRTRVKIRVTASALERMIDPADRVFVMGHSNGDMDCVGAAVGVAAICRKKGKPVSIIAENREVPASSLVRRLKETEAFYQETFISAQEALEQYTDQSILVVVDTNRPTQVASPELLERASRIAVIDHHRRAQEYIEAPMLNCQEPYASSACELVTELIEYIMDASDLMRVEAEALLAGIVLDTKSFAVRTGGRTFEAAAYLRRCGADTSEVKRLFQNNLPDTIRKNSIIQSANIYRNGIAIAFTEENVGRVIAAQAADALLNVEGVDTSFVLFLDGDTAYLSGRSVGTVNVQIILEALGGGGNAAAAGAQIPDSGGSAEVLRRLRRAIDTYIDGK